jgi:DNA-binding transcriptional LysR family regulator
VVELRQLQYFVALSEEGTFARAADRQHITQSALSQQVARLERELEVRLFERSARGASLTEAGAALLPLAADLLSGVAAFTAKASSIVRETRHELHVGSPTYAVRSPARQRAVALFVAHHPTVEVSFTNAWSPELLVMLEEGALDLSFAMLAPDSASLDFILLQDEAALLVVPADHPLAGFPQVGWRDLAGETLLLYPPAVNAWLHERMARPAEHAGVVAGLLEESSLPAALQQVAQGRGLFPAVPWEMGFVNPDQLDRLAVVPTSGEPGLRYALWLARRSGAQTQLIDAFWRSAVQSCQVRPSGAF